ncbi:MAG TPA: lamin tail domain-containing protein [Pyrinomonadaceae bacterium]|jgi:hypothetical protein
MTTTKAPVVTPSSGATSSTAAAADDPGLPSAPSTTLVISQFYGGAGCGTAGCSTYKNDYIELFNRGSVAQSVNGWSVQYAAATGTSWQMTNLPNVSVPAGGYLLVAEGAGANGVNNLPTPDVTGSISMSATAAKLALVNTTTALSGRCGNGAALTLPASAVDFVGYGTTPDCNDAGATTGGTGNAPAPSTTNADIRAAAGCTDTDNNAADFAAAAANPRNSATALNACSGPPPAVSLAVNDVSQNEGNAATTAFTFSVTLSAPAGPGGVTFDICTADGTAQDDNPATEDNDYAANCLTGQSIPLGSNGPYNFTVNVNGDATVEPNETFFVNVINVVGATVADGQGQGTVVNDDFTVTPIHNIQGNGAASPLAGQAVATTGIVTLLRTSSNDGGGAASGYFLQAPDAEADADPNTSEGIFVFTSSVPTVSVGDEVRVTGTVQEFNGLTEIGSVTNTSIIDTGNPLPTAVTLDSTILDPAAAPTQPQLEKYEGMRLSASSLVTVAPNDTFFDVYTVLANVARPVREPGIPASDPVPPDPTSGVPDCCIPIWDENPERLLVDTNGRAGATNNAYTSNVTLTSVSGPLDYAFGAYRLVSDAALSASANMTAVAVPEPLASEFTVAGYNIENFNNDATQRQKAALTVRDVLHYPDIIGAVEIFDLADLRALRDQINDDAVAAGDPDPQYEAYLVEADGTSEDDDQDVGFLVKISRVSVTSVTQEREEETYVEPGTGTVATLHDRPPLVLDAVVDPSGTNPRRVLVVVNHLRSFIDIELVAGDGPRVREKRKKQAESLADLLNDLQTDNPGVPVISVGDYNAIQFSSGYDDSLSVIKGTPTPDDEIVVDQSPDLVNPDFVNLIDGLPADEQYSFVFEGTPQALDHHVVNAAARARNTRTAIARVNSDFPEVPAAAFAADAARPERNSDHDPVVSYYSLGDGQAAGSFIISEFRFRGPNLGEEEAGPKTGGGGDTPGGPNAPGGPAENDEFIEFYNNTDSDITVSTIDGSPGWALVASDGQVRFIIPNGTVIPARHHFLAANTDGFSLFDYGLPAFGYDLDILDESGVALFRTANPSFFTADERLDAVGYASAPELYREGAGLPVGAEVGGELEYSWVRHMCAFVQGVGCTTPGIPKDSGVNALDFISVDTTGATQSLGAPGPEGLISPLQRNADFPGALLDTGRSAGAPPNRVRDFLDTGLNKSFGTMSIRRTFTNNTGGPVEYLAFRVVQITTYPQTPALADLRVLDSSDINVTLSNGTEVPVSGTFVEQPPTQFNGGGHNSSLGVNVLDLGGTLEDGDSISVQFLLGIEKTGTFRFYINVEAFDDCGCPAASESQKTQKAQKGQPRVGVLDAERPKTKPRRGRGRRR